jgi:DNA-binding IclR family transcriptional regulator
MRPVSTSTGTRACDARFNVWTVRRFDSDDLHTSGKPRCDAANKSAAANGSQHCVDVRQLRVEFDRNGSLSRYRSGIVECMHFQRPRFSGPGFVSRECFDISISGYNDLRTEIRQRLAFERGRQARVSCTLAQQERVIQDDKTYRLSFRLTELFQGTGASAGTEAALTMRMMLLLHRLVNETGGTAHFAVLDGDRFVYLAKVDSPHPICMFSQTGWRGPLHATGVGKILLASTESTLLSRICDSELEQFTPKTIVEKGQLQAELAQIRKQEYALDAEELIEGLTCVAVPVMSGGQVRGAISVGGPTGRLGNPKALAKILKAAAKT